MIPVGNTENMFFSLVRLGVCYDNQSLELSKDIDWSALEDLAARQGLSAIVLDGIEKLPTEYRPPKEVLLQWIGSVIQLENSGAVQWKAECELATLLRDNQIKTYVMKGAVVSECYPNPRHRQSVDMDCFLTEGVQELKGSRSSSYDVWEKGNKIVEEKGFEVERIHYKNSTWFLPGLTVENHQFLTPFRGNNTLKKLERLLQSMLYEDKGEDQIDGTWLFRPPVMVSAIFLIEHAYTHFLHEGLTWRHILDWMMFSRKHEKEINWTELEVLIDEFGFRKFYDSYHRLGKYLLGEITEEDLIPSDRMMLKDVWGELDIHETVRGIKGKLALVGNTWRARWKYRQFTDMTWLKAIWIQVKGFLFMKSPSLV